MKLSHSQAALLKRLTNGPKDLKMFSHGDTGNSQMSFHYPRYLKEMEEAGYVYEENELWYITKIGSEYLQRQADTTASGQKFTTWKTNDFYDGKELLNSHTRSGCYDFQKHPSLMYGNKVTVERA